jgi:hypothetical protein
MSAGKGSKPRPVDPQRYAANYDAIRWHQPPVGSAGPADRPPYPDWICRICGSAHGIGMPAGHVSTWHIGPCGICGQFTSVTEPRDYGHLREWPLSPDS